MHSSHVRRAAMVVLLGLAAVTIASLAIGRYGAPHRHGSSVDATLAATAGTAIGTTLLALFTAWLAWSTLRDQQERDRPVLVTLDAPSWMRIRLDRDEPGGGRITFALANVGLGPALGVEVTARCKLTPDVEVRPWVCSAVTPGGYLYGQTIEVLFPTEPPREFSGRDFTLHGTYTDRLGRGPYEVLTKWTPPPQPLQPEHAGDPTTSD